MCHQTYALGSPITHGFANLNVCLLDLNFFRVNDIIFSTAQCNPPEKTIIKNLFTHIRNAVTFVFASNWKLDVQKTVIAKYHILLATILAQRETEIKLC